MSDLQNTKMDGIGMTTTDNDNRTTITETEKEKDETMILDSLIGDQAQAMIGEDIPGKATDDLPVVAAVEFVDLSVASAADEVDLPVVADVVVDPLAADGEVPVAKEIPMVASVDPAMCSFSSAFMSVDDTAVSGSPHSAVEIPASLVPEKGKEEDEIIGKKKVIGRKLAVVDDDDEFQSSKSARSADDDVLLASSSKAKRKGFKRGRRTVKGKVKDTDFIDDGETSSESSADSMKKKKRKGKRREVRVTPEEEASDGERGEPKGIIEQPLEVLSSSVLGGAIMEWANKIDEIRVKSKKLQGRFSGEIKKCVTKIKEGTTLLVIRSEAAGDPHFLRMRNSELSSQLREAERENARLTEQLKRMSPKASPPRKRRVQKTEVVPDPAHNAPKDPALPKRPGTPSIIRDAFPPLPQRPPRVSSMATKSDGGPVVPVAGTSSAIPSDGVGAESGMEAYYTRRINTLMTARDLEIERRRKEKLGKEQVGPKEGKNGKGVDKDGNRDGTPKDGTPKVGPKILSDVRIVPPLLERSRVDTLSPAMSELEAEWRTALGGRRRGRGKPLKPSQLHIPPVPSPRSTDVDPSSVTCDTAGTSFAATQRPLPRQPPKVRPPRPPAYSAVTITGKAGDFSYASALKYAREHIDLGSLGIQDTRVRKAINGGLLIEVSGEGSKVKAEELMARLRGVLKESATVSCPIKMRELRIIGFDESVTPDEITEVLSEMGQCSVSDIKVGPIRYMNNGLGMVWAKLPVAAAAKVVVIGRIRIGWTMARIELLEDRPLQCFKCWSFGHVQSMCRSIVDRHGACFRCGQRGHIASACGNAAHCAVCHDAGLEASHRLGGPQCAAQPQQDNRMADRRTRMTTRFNV